MCMKLSNCVRPALALLTTERRGVEEGSLNWKFRALFSAYNLTGFPWVLDWISIWARNGQLHATLHNLWYRE
jgi:hypothetical protein